MSEYTEQLEEVFISVLEKLAFMFAEAVPKDEMPTRWMLAPNRNLF